MKTSLFLAAATSMFALALAGCPAGGNEADMGTPMGPMGGPITGALDTHCTGDGMPIITATDQTTCMFIPDMKGIDGGIDNMVDYGDTEYNSEGDDDDCKYHVKFTSTVYKSSTSSFVVTATKRSDGSALTGANTTPEIFLSDTHAISTAKTRTVEGPPGTYTISPVQFDASGKWTVRFHFYEQCTDFLDSSPHGHIAFYINVP